MELRDEVQHLREAVRENDEAFLMANEIIERERLELSSARDEIFRLKIEMKEMVYRVAEVEVEVEVEDDDDDDYGSMVESESGIVGELWEAIDDSGGGRGRETRHDEGRQLRLRGHG